jgi:ABC-type sugar transport system ATPase subunit
VAEVQLLQPLGSEVIATLKVGEKTFTAEAFSGWLVEEGFRATGRRKVWVTFEEGKLHLFDAQTEKALL